MDTNTNEFKRILKFGWVVLVILAVFLAAEALGALKSLRSTDPVFNSIAVTGEGKVFSVPDIATFTLTVSADAKTVSDAQTQVTAKMNAVIDGLKGLSIDEKDIKTTGYNVYPKYKNEVMPCVPGSYCPPSRQIPDGYTASHTLLIKVRKTENAGKALQVAGDKGATDLSGISFTIDDPDKLMEQARAAAIDDARAKAKTLSKQLGVHLVRVVSFSDNSGGVPVPIYAEAVKASDAGGGASPAPTLPTGENEVRVDVTVTYEIR